jgi:hypothetical protein
MESDGWSRRRAVAGSEPLRGVEAPGGRASPGAGWSLYRFRLCGLLRGGGSVRGFSFIGRGQLDGHPVVTPDKHYPVGCNLGDGIPAYLLPTFTTRWRLPLPGSSGILPVLYEARRVVSIIVP